MKLYVLCSYGDSLNDPSVSTDYQELHKKMEKNYRMTLDHVSQTEEEQENTYLSGFSAKAVIHGNWIEWSITELDLPVPSDKIKMTDLKLDIWNEWLREKQQKLEEILSTLSPYENTDRYYRIAGHIDGLIDALTM